MAYGSLMTKQIRSSGNNNHGVLDNGAKAGQAGKFGDSIVTKPQQAVTVPITKSLDSINKNQMSLGGWFRVDEPSDTGHRRNGAYLLEDQSGGEQNPDGWVLLFGQMQGYWSGMGQEKGQTRCLDSYHWNL